MNTVADRAELAVAESVPRSVSGGQVVACRPRRRLHRTPYLYNRKLEALRNMQFFNSFGWQEKSRIALLRPQRLGRSDPQTRRLRTPASPRIGSFPPSAAILSNYDKAVLSDRVTWFCRRGILSIEALDARAPEQPMR